MAALLDVPRSVLLALWLSAGTDPVRAGAAVQGDDEPHTVQADGRTGAALTTWLRALPPVEAVSAVLPVPGDPVVVAPPAAADALDAGECVLLATAEGTVAAVPHVERFGSALEPGHLVRWRTVEVPDWRTAVLGRVGSLADAERDLRESLRVATEALVDLDVARWRPEAAEEVADLRTAALAPTRVPPHLDGQRLRVLASAARLRGVVRLATQDHGGAVNAWQVDQRSTALREVDRVARRAMAAAATSLDPR